RWVRTVDGRAIMMGGWCRQAPPRSGAALLDADLQAVLIAQRLERQAAAVRAAGLAMRAVWLEIAAGAAHAEGVIAAAALHLRQQAAEAELDGFSRGVLKRVHRGRDAIQRIALQDVPSLFRHRQADAALVPRVGMAVDQPARD